MFTFASLFLKICTHFMGTIRGCMSLVQMYFLKMSIAIRIKPLSRESRDELLHSFDLNWHSLGTRLKWQFTKVFCRFPITLLVAIVGSSHFLREITIVTFIKKMIVPIIEFCPLLMKEKRENDGQWNNSYWINFISTFILTSISLL